MFDQKVTEPPPRGFQSALPPTNTPPGRGSLEEEIDLPTNAFWVSDCSGCLFDWPDLDNENETNSWTPGVVST